MADHNCSKRVYSGTRYGFGGGHLCSRKGVVERDGQWWCNQHDPEAVKAREAKKSAERHAAYEADAAVKRESLDLIKRLGFGTPHFSPISHKYTGGVVLSQSEAEALVARLKEASRDA